MLKIKTKAQFIAQNFANFAKLRFASQLRIGQYNVLKHGGYAISYYSVRRLLGKIDIKENLREIHLNYHFSQTLSVFSIDSICHPQIKKSIVPTKLTNQIQRNF